MKLRFILMIILLFGAGSHTLILSKHVTQAKLEERQVLTGGSFKSGRDHLGFAKIESKSPCDRAGIRVNDELIAINGQMIHNVDEVVAIYSAVSSDNTLLFHVRRDGVDLEFKVIPHIFYFTRHNLIMQGFYIVQWLFIPLQLMLIFFLWRDRQFFMLPRTKFIAAWVILPILAASIFMHGVDALYLRLVFGVMIGSQFTALTVLLVFLGADHSESDDPNLYTSGVFGIYFALILVMILLPSFDGFAVAHTVYMLPFLCALIGIVFVALYVGIDNVFLQRFMPELAKNIYTQIFFLLVCWSITFFIAFMLIWGEYPQIYSHIGSVFMTSLALMVPFLVVIMVYWRMKRNLEKSYETIKEQEFLQREMDMARIIQERLLPHCPDFLFDMESCTYSLPAIEVGGDFFDVIDLGNGKIGICIGDVSGKGLSAAFYMARITGMARVLAGIIDHPGDLLKKLSGHICADLEPHVFITALYAVYDSPNKTLQVARAGHNPLLRYSSSSGCVEMIRPEGAGIGVPLVQDFPIVSQHLDIGDFLVFFTDGVTEAMNQYGDEFGEDRLITLVKNSKNARATDLMRRIVSAVAEFTGQAKQHDDITLLVFRLTDAGSRSACLV